MQLERRISRVPKSAYIMYNFRLEKQNKDQFLKGGEKRMNNRKWGNYLFIAAAAVLTFTAGGCTSEPATEEEPKAEVETVAMYVPYGTEDGYIMVDQDTGAVFTVTMPDEIYDAEGNPISQEDLEKGNILRILGDGIMLESYPGTVSRCGEHSGRGRGKTVRRGSVSGDRGRDLSGVRPLRSSFHECGV